MLFQTQTSTYELKEEFEEGEDLVIRKVSIKEGVESGIKVGSVFRGVCVQINISGLKLYDSGGNCVFHTTPLEF